MDKSSMPQGLTRPCHICGHSRAGCICPKCPVCEDQGITGCYKYLEITGRQSHNMMRNKQQMIGATKLQIAYFHEQIQEQELYIMWLREQADNWTEEVK